MPCRYIRDGFLTSEKVDLLSAESERFFFRLLLVIDDYGRYLANKRILKSTCYPLKESIGPEEVGKWLAECVAAGLVTLYAVDGKKYVHVPNFTQNPRAKKSKYPEPQPQNCMQMHTDVNRCIQMNTDVNMCMQMNADVAVFDNDNDNDNEVVSLRAHASAQEADEKQRAVNDNNKNVFIRQQSQIIPYPTAPHEVVKEAEKICFPMTTEEAETFIAYYAATGWIIRGEPIRDWRKSLTIWKTNRRKEPSYAGNQRHDYKRVATDEEFHATTHFDDPAEFLAPAARGIVEGKLPQGAGSEKH